MTEPSSMEEWRSRHWVVLIDDEPAIRLAIGDYLHSMGYSVVTACDGPMSFLEVLLWSCSWSLAPAGEEEEEDGARESRSPPPWMGEDGGSDWRLPNCIISDIRMPGGIDGVQLLELMRRPPSSGGEEGGSSQAGPKRPAKGRKEGRVRGRKGDASAVYDERDEFELLDAIIVGDGGKRGERITTPSDQAAKYLDAVRGCIDYHSCQQTEGRTHRRRYPASVQQIPVILLTAKAMVSDRIVGYRAGANGYLPKPFRPEELLGMIDNLMRKQERERLGHVQSRDQSAANNSGDAEEGGGIEEDLTPEQAAEITEELIEIKELLRARLEERRAGREDADLERILPEALWMVRTGERRKKVFTRDHIGSILRLRFGADTPKGSARRSEMLRELDRLRDEFPERLE